MNLFDLLGIKPDQLIAGAFGAGVSLAVSPKMRPCAAFGAIAVGMVTSWYVPPLVIYYASWPAAMERPLAFVAGLVGMAAAGAVVNLAADPIGAYRRFRGTE